MLNTLGCPELSETVWKEKLTEIQQYLQQNLLNGHHGRKDYDELVTLAYLFLGDQLDVPFRYPGAHQSSSSQMDGESRVGLYALKITSSEIR